MSSTPNKRSIDEGGNGSGNYGHSSSMMKPQHEDSSACPGVGAKAMSSISGQFHVPYETGQESRMPKYPRSESRDIYRRLPPGLSSSSNASSHDHVTGPDSRLDYRGPKDNNRDPKFESREHKVESRGFYQGNKFADVKLDSRGGENKDPKDGHFELRGDLRTDKDTYYGGASTHTSSKDPNESLRGKSYLDTSGGNMEPWHTRSSLLVSGEKDAAHFKEKDDAEAHEAVGENKVDLRGDDKFKDKDRKRKEGKHREWGERDKDRNDHRNDGEHKDLVKNERETERWEKERKDLSKEKEKVKDSVKDYIKKEAGTGAEKDGLHILVIPARAAELENSTTELKKVKDGDGWRVGGKDTEERKHDRDVDAEECKRLQDKESNEGCRDDEGGTEKEKEGFSHVIQQRKRMLRPKGSPQRSNRDPTFRLRTHDNEGSQGEADVSTVTYRVGECMQELIKLWKEYESSQADRTSESSLLGPTLDIRIPAEHVSATNRQVRGGQLWGTDVYTDDSDLVAVLMHTGYCRPTASLPPATIQELRVTIRVLPPQDSYVSSLRNNVRSRAWGSGIGCSYRVERCCIVKKEGGSINLEPCLTHSSTLEPTLAPVSVERTMTTRAAASNALRQQRFVREVTIQFSLCCEPWLKYSISVVADKGLKKANYTSSRLKKGEVLYLETHSRRYELCFNGEKMVRASKTSQAHETETDTSQTHHSLVSNGERDGENGVIDVFRWSQCKKALPQRMMKAVGIPLPPQHVEVLEDNLEWEDIRWSSTSVHINGKEYALARAHFLSLQSAAV